MSKNDLSVIVDIEEIEDVSINYEDMYDETKLLLNVRTTEDAHKKVISNPYTKVAMVMYRFNVSIKLSNINSYHRQM